MIASRCNVSPPPLTKSNARRIKKLMGYVPIGVGRRLLSTPESRAELRKTEACLHVMEAMMYPEREEMMSPLDPEDIRIYLEEEAETLGQKEIQKN